MAKGTGKGMPFPSKGTKKPSMPMGKGGKGKGC